VGSKTEVFLKRPERLVLVSENESLDSKKQLSHRIHIEKRLPTFTNYPCFFWFNNISTMFFFSNLAKKKTLSGFLMRKKL